jgi:hypothetical protein
VAPLIFESPQVIQTKEFDMAAGKGLTSFDPDHCRKRIFASSRDYPDTQGDE